MLKALLNGFFGTQAFLFSIAVIIIFLVVFFV